MSEEIQFPLLLLKSRKNPEVKTQLAPQTLFPPFWVNAGFSLLVLILYSNLNKGYLLPIKKKNKTFVAPALRVERTVEMFDHNFNEWRKS